MPTRIAYWPTKKARKPENRPNAAARGYCDSRHAAWRKAVLVRDNYQCRACGRICTKKREAHADHIIAVALRPDLRYVLDNGQCLCASCHSKKTLQNR